MGDSIFRKKRKGRGIWFVPPVLLILYCLLFPRPGGRETFLRPVWTRPLSSPTLTAPRPDQSLYSFRTGNLFGYADLAGNITYLGSALHNVSLSEAGFINYGRVPDHVVFMDTGGEFQYSIKSYGYPLLDPSGRLLYSVNTDLSGLKRIDPEGEVLWAVACSSPLTSFATWKDECTVGLMEGKLLYIGSDGKILYEYEPRGSRIHVVLGTAISGDGQKLAILSGIDPQRLDVIERRGRVFSPLYTLDLPSDFRREVTLRFGPEDRFLFFEVEDGLGVLDVRKAQTATVQIPGVLRALDANSALSVAAFESADSFRLLVFRPFAPVLLSCGLKADDVFVKVLGSSLVLGLDANLLRADLLEG